jgi:hypothetical protein
VAGYHGTLTLTAAPRSMVVMARTLRLQADQEDLLREMARVDGIPVSDEIREAIADHIERRRKDAAFQARLHASLERHRELLETLADR